MSAGIIVINDSISPKNTSGTRNKNRDPSRKTLDNLINSPLFTLPKKDGIDSTSIQKREKYQIAKCQQRKNMPGFNTENTEKSKSPKVHTPLARRLHSKNVSPQCNTINTWLSKVGSKKIEPRKSTLDEKYKKLDVQIKKALTLENQTENKKSKKENGCKTEQKTKERISERKKSSKKESTSKTEKKDFKSISDLKQRKIDTLLKKSIKDTKTIRPKKKPKLSRQDSSGSCELPSFKPSNKSKKRNKNNDSFKKYGLALSSVDDILKDKEDLQQYKNQVESFKQLEDRSFEISFSIKDFDKTEETNIENLLDCKHLSLNRITELFEKYVGLLSDIFNCKIPCERHERFHNKSNKSCTPLTKDYTGLIVFNFDQVDHMITLLKEQFDPDDKLTQYFFQVLLPELCLKIFMDTHDMTYNEAVQYLETRPVV